MVYQNQKLTDLLDPDTWARSVPAILKEQHSFLLESLEKHLKHEDKSPTLLVLGPGGSVLPYSTRYEGYRLTTSNRDRIKGMIRDGKVILSECMAENSRQGWDLKNESRTLEAMGFFDPGYFNRGCLTSESLDPNDLDKAVIAYMENNLKDNLKVQDETVSAIDANLVLHQVTVIREEQERLYKEMLRVLRPGGVLHLGEAELDTMYTEDKIGRIGMDLSSFFGSSLVVKDNRRKGNIFYPFCYVFEKGRSYNSLHNVNEAELGILSGRFTVAAIDPDGMVIVRVNDSAESDLPKDRIQNLKDYLSSKGYKTMTLNGAELRFPLIDQEMPEDLEHLIRPIDIYYDSALNILARRLSGVNDEVAAQMASLFTMARGIVKKGIAVYSVGEKETVDLLKKVGFGDVLTSHYLDNPYYNILARKPN